MDTDNQIVDWATRGVHNSITRTFLGRHTLPFVGTFEVFYADHEHGRTIPAGKSPTHLGYYWQSCTVQGVPDGPRSGQFPTAEGAYLDAIGE